ncbi:MAG: methylated-DNA--[protein]-cysteine S-methyltransferase [Robiginitomaculum sp.]|nr:methylated-DNA--[protein]-cysteine S-methyltransferase [Robiginitomaculum sp.]
MRDLKKTSDKICYYDYLDTPIGSLLLAGCDAYLRFVSFPPIGEEAAQAGHEGHIPRDPLPAWKQDRTKFTQARQELTEYFAGTRIKFTVAIKLSGSDFQRSVWQALIDVPYGETCSYGDIAHAINNPKSSRAVGGANNANPIPVIVPCHRIIGADKSMTGFGGGIPTKEFLLDLEGRVAGTRLL